MNVGSAERPRRNEQTHGSSIYRHCGLETLVKLLLFVLIQCKEDERVRKRMRRRLHKSCYFLSVSDANCMRPYLVACNQEDEDVACATS